MRKSNGIVIAVLAVVIATIVLSLVAAEAHGVTVILPDKFGPKIKQTHVRRKTEGLHGSRWTYTLRLVGDNFNRRSKVWIDGEEFKGAHTYHFSGKDVYSIEVTLGTWSRIYVEPKEHQVVVVTPKRVRQDIQEMRSPAVAVEW